MTQEIEQWMKDYVNEMMGMESVFNDGKPLSNRQRVSVLTRIVQRNPKGGELAVAAEALIHEALQEREAGEWMFSLGTGCIPPSAPARIKTLASAYAEARTVGEKMRRFHAFVYAWNDWVNTQSA